MAEQEPGGAKLELRLKMMLLVVLLIVLQMFVSCVALIRHTLPPEVAEVENAGHGHTRGNDSE